MQAMFSGKEKVKSHWIKENILKSEEHYCVQPHLLEFLMCCFYVP